jgi:DNA-binding transcriptional MerR regulator
MQFEPKKLYYKIREVCEIIGVEAHVLRYWETEFPSLAPAKNKSGQRVYRPKDIELLLRIRTLLYEEGFTIAGARKQLGSGKQRNANPPESARSSSGEKAPAQNAKRPAKSLERVRAELENILTLLDRG